MEDKKATEILLNMIKKYNFNKEEEEAIHTSIGILSWMHLRQGKIKAIKDKNNKEIKW